MIFMPSFFPKEVRTVRVWSDPRMACKPEMGNVAVDMTAFEGFDLTHFEHGSKSRLSFMTLMDLP